MVEESLRLMRSDLLNRGVSLGTELASALPAVNGDRNQLQQVLLNLMMNGCDAMEAQPTDRRLRIITRANVPGRVEIAVSDRGTGIAPADLERIFEPFVTTKAQGMGLGLAICRSIVGAHGGRLWATNNADSRRHAALRTAHPAPIEPMQAPAPTVYLVDDDPDLLKALQRLLQSAGLQVVAFASAQAFLQGHDRNAPGCLVLDLSMPGLNGLQLQRELEQQGSPLPIVFLSGRGDIAATVQAMKHGATDFLTKPVDDTELLAAIHEALATDRQRRRSRAERERIAQCLAALTGARAPGAGARRRRTPEQADRRRTGHGREDHQVPPRQPDAQDGCALGRRAGQAGRTRGHRHRSEQAV